MNNPPIMCGNGVWRPLAASRAGMIVLLLAAGQAVAAEEARQWLTRMVEAARTLSYQGIYIYRHGATINTFGMAHRSDSTGVRERLFALDGKPREVIRHHHTVTCILPEDMPLMESKRSLCSVNTGPFLAGPFAAAPGIPDSYQVKLDGEERTAGRTAVKLTVMPRDVLRYGYRLWVDQTTALLLRSALIAPQGEVLEEFVYASIQVPALVRDEALQPAIGGRGFMVYTSQIPAAATDGRRPFVKRGSNWRVAWMPHGFQMRERLVDAIPDSSPLEHLVFTDGLASVSVFIEQFNHESASLTGHFALGAVSAFGLTIGIHQVTVVGEVPPQTVERIGQSVAAND